MTLIYLTFSLPFAIWLMVSYFEDVPREMEEAALIDRAGRWRAFLYVVLPQVRGGIAVTVIFVFLNAWNEFLFAVVLGGNNVRQVTVAMFNFISVEQTMWAKLAAAAIVTMAPVLLLGLFAQRHIVKGLTVGAVKGVVEDEQGRPRRAEIGRQAPRSVHGTSWRRSGDRTRRVLRVAGALGSGKSTTLRIDRRARGGQ